MAHYYETPTPDRFVGWVKECSAAGVFEKQSARFPFMIFVSEVLKQNPDKAIEWSKQLSSLPSADKAYFGWSLRNSGTIQADDALRIHLRLSDDDIKGIMTSNRYDPLSREPSNPGDLDMLWAVFMATGSSAAVNRIIDVLSKPLPPKGSPGSVEMLVMKGAAKWSLTSNIRQHKRVTEIAKIRRDAEKGSLKDELDEVIGNASKE